MKSKIKQKIDVKKKTPKTKYYTHQKKSSNECFIEMEETIKDFQINF